MREWRPLFEIFSLYSAALPALFILLWPAKPEGGVCLPSPSARGYSFVNADIVDPRAPLSPYLPGFKELYERYGRQAQIQREDNVDEWRERFCMKPRRQDIGFVVYRASIDDLQRLRTAAGSRSFPMPGVFSNNTFARLLERHRCYETIDYLIFAKRCEPHVHRADSWDNTPRDVNAMRALIEEARAGFLAIQSHFIRLRYAYQLIRLAHYAGLYEETLELHDYLMPKIDNDPSIIDYWIMGHQAGALMALGRTVEASYLYALIFQNCPSKRESAFRSFRIRDDEEWQQCLLLCRDDRERATLYAIRGHAANSRTVEEMRAIYALDPNNENLEPLLVKEMLELEKGLLGREFSRNIPTHLRTQGLPRPGAGERAIELRQFLRLAATEGKVSRLDFWKIAEGYLEVLMGDFYAAQHSFTAASRLVSNPELKEQLAIFDKVLRISAWTNIDENLEEEIDRIQRNEPVFKKYADLNPFLDDKLTLLYKQNNRPGKAFISQYPLAMLKPNPREDIINDLLRVCRKENPTRLESRMIQKPSGGTIIHDLIEMKATMQLANFQPEAALRTLQEIPAAYRDDYGLFNPFVERVNDCVHCLLPDTVQVYNKVELLKRLSDFEFRARADPNQSAYLYFRLGVAYYNMSYFSYSWRAMSYFRSGANLSPRYFRDADTPMPYPGFPYGVRAQFNTDVPMAYFQRALELARHPELAARAAFWAAKCERNSYYLNRNRGAARTYQYFEELKKYRDTEYYQQVIRECNTFEAYLAR